MTALEAMTKYFANHSPDDPDLSAWPPDVIEIIQLVCKLWHLRPPQTKKSKAYWIMQARELDDACGEFYPAEILADYRERFETAMEKNRQKIGWATAPHTVEGPGSLVKMVRALAGEIRGDEEREKRWRRSYADHA